MPSVFYIIVVLGIITSPSVVSGLTCLDPPQQFSREIVNGDRDNCQIVKKVFRAGRP